MTKQEFIDWIGIEPEFKGLAMVTLEGVIAEAIAEHDEAVKLRILEMEQEIISNATYSDTEYDNEAVVYGYNEAIADIIGNAFKIERI